MNSSSRTIARIVGPAAIALAVTEWMNMDIFAAQTAPVVYLNGTLLWVAGVAVVQAHNRWRRGWPLVVTLVGWALSAIGLLRMIAPEAVRVQEGPLVNAVFVGLGLLGAFLSLKGYGPRAPDPGPRVSDTR